jgi:hypothetical protein
LLLPLLLVLAPPWPRVTLLLVLLAVPQPCILPSCLAV